MDIGLLGVLPGPLPLAMGIWHATEGFRTLMITPDTFMYSIVLYDFPNNHL